MFDDVEMNSEFASYDELLPEAEGIEANDVGRSSCLNDDGIAEPFVGMEFHSEHAAKKFYDEYAKKLGFDARTDVCSRSISDQTLVALVFVCSYVGLKRKSPVGCRALLRIELKGDGKWIVVKYVKEHNHSMSRSGNVKCVRPRRNVSDNSHGTRNSILLSAQYNKISSPLSHGAKPIAARRTLERDAQNMLEYLKKMQAENPGFFYAIQLDDDNQLTNVFWADARSRAAYCNFGDALVVDTRYRLNQYKVPFVSFTGVNHHGHTILFGCAIVLDESELSFIWLFSTFLTAMNHHPSSITTDRGRDLEYAVSLVFPGARHCASIWNVLREGQEKLKNVHPNLQMELNNCINFTETVEDFESNWCSIIEKYHLQGHAWLESLYNSRGQWAPAFFRDSFFAVISSDQDPGSFFDGYVNQQTPLPIFFRQYERALERWLEMEQDADFETISSTPLTKTPSPMEKQAASVYTKRIFEKFQDELVETFAYTANKIEGDGASAVFRVAKFDDDIKAYMVTFNYVELTASCSCQMFEYSGILCRHVLTVFTVNNILTLPAHYILKRWTVNAKSNYRAEDGGELNNLESATVRYNNLCRKSIKFSQDAAVTMETYKVAMSTLKEGEKRLAFAKKGVAKAVPLDEEKSAFNATSDAIPTLWPRQEDVFKRCNLNDGGTVLQSVADLNLPYMSPVSLQRDDSPETMTSLPKLKSMTWVMENKSSSASQRIAIINLKLLDCTRVPSTDMEVKFQLSKLTLEPIIRSMASISEQLSSPGHKVAVIKLKLNESEATSGEFEIKFQVSRDTLSAMLRSMAYIGEQLTNSCDSPLELPTKKQRK